MNNKLRNTFKSLAYGQSTNELNIATNLSNVKRKHNKKLEHNIKTFIRSRNKQRAEA